MNISTIMKLSKALLSAFGLSGRRGGKKKLPSVKLPSVKLPSVKLSIGTASGGTGKPAGGGQASGAAKSAVAGVALTDPRDGQTYKTVRIGNLVWMAENLRFNAEGSWCYGDDEAKCAEYGRLYDWETAKAACPSGWRLPTPEEWDALAEAAGGGDAAGQTLKSAGGWKTGGGTDGFGFTALPAGARYADGSFSGAGKNASWWTASHIGGHSVRGRCLSHKDNQLARVTALITNGYSVRCVRDDDDEGGGDDEE